MSCLFCDSFYHFSQDCDIYITDESRKDLLKSKKLCLKCLKPLNECDDSHFRAFDIQRCYICFSKHHSVIFCPERLTATKVFYPEIDGLLFPRFFQMFDPAERCSMAFSSTKKDTNMKRLIIVYTLKYYYQSLKDHADCDFIFSEDLELENFSTLSNQEMRISKRAGVKTKILILKDSTISSKDFYYLLTPNLKVLKCSNVQLSSNISFVNVLKRIPNIEDLQICSSSPRIKIENSWLKDLLKYKTGNNIRMLKLDVYSLDLSLSDLVKFITTKCVQKCSNFSPFYLNRYRMDRYSKDKKEIFKIFSFNK